MIPSQSFWGDVDSLDVDILAEYLLDDIGGPNVGGASFDFPYVYIYIYLPADLI
jgi:hypothetical protein